MSYDPDYEEFPAVKVGQALGNRAEAILTENGFIVAAGGWADGSTSYALMLGDDDGRPAKNGVSEKAQECLWDNGFGWVEVTTEPVEV